METIIFVNDCQLKVAAAVLPTNKTLLSPPSTHHSTASGYSLGSNIVVNCFVRAQYLGVNFIVDSIEVGNIIANKLCSSAQRFPLCCYFSLICCRDG
jgi:hypothetical protein